jgi:bifunctional NMN adenylyltransferase/nudix hydrolase
MPTAGVIIGRFQPFHQGHHYLIRKALSLFEHLVIVLGSADRARSIVNPFTVDERIYLLQENLVAYKDRIHIVAVPDVFYDEAYWCKLVRAVVSQALSEAIQITLCGHTKDVSSYYLQEFPQWSYLEFDNYENISATPLRLEYLLTGKIDAINFSIPTQEFLMQFKKTPGYAWLCAEAQFIQTYKNSWQNTPYPPIFVTTDAVVICKKHLLLVERKHAPGKGLLALPGGFLEPGEWIEQGLMRELLEETNIQGTLIELKKALRQIRVFDYPGRSQIGRVVSHVGLFNLQVSTLPAVSGQDDAAHAFWVPLEQLPELAARLHDDHFQIIDHFTRQGLIES